VNRSTYYKHFHSEPAPRIRENQDIKRIILQVYSDYDKFLGAYKITYILERDYGIHISVGRVYRLMSSMNLPKISTDKPHRCKHQNNGECNNHLHQEFNQKAPNLVWASDFTYIKINGKWYYLCIVMDLFSRKIIGWHISSKHDADLTMHAFKKAYQKRNIQYGLIFHSDQGSEYTAFAFRKLLDSCNVVQSFSKKGYPFDNACCESFFKYLKKNRTNRKTYHTQEELRLDIFEYIEKLYNNRLPHGAIGYKTPNEYEAEYWDQMA
jgi:putative transposase